MYAVASWVIALSYELSFRHDVDSIVLSINNGQSYRGYVAFDMQRRFLGANEKAMEFLPMLRSLPLDRPIGKKIQAQRIIFYQMMASLEEGAANIRFEESREKRILKYEISYFYSRKNAATIGYIFEISDDAKFSVFASCLVSVNIPPLNSVLYSPRASLSADSVIF